MASDPPKGNQRRRRTKFDKNQYKVLIEAFERDPYPGIDVREELAELTHIPEPRIQVWFQNRRSRIPKKSQRSLGVEAFWAQIPAQIPDQSHPGVCTPNYSWLQSFPEAQNDASCLSWESGDVCGPAVFPGPPGIMDMNVALPPDPETPGGAMCEPSRDASCSPSSSQSPEALLLLPASQQPFTHLKAGGAGTGLQEPRLLHVHRDLTLQGEGQCPLPSGQQPSMGWQPPRALQPGMAPL